ncbi:uncharacterized protein LOC143741171 [Siphateles boraxobius]|uniref:uncharacterized protein LOC143741171 n=1 Tax=Siphateles boraxobius TaxID=180520 RepID=UPI0040647C5D
MESNIYFVKFENSDIKGTPEPLTTSHHQDEGKTRKCRGCRCLVLMTVCLGLICALLLVFNILQHITIISYKNAFEEFKQTINSLQDNNTDLMIEKDQLQNNFNSLSQKKLELETRVNSLTAEKKQLQSSVDSLSQKKLELETRVNNLTAEKSQLQNSLNSSNQKNLELETRVNNLTAEKSQLQRSVDSLNQNKLELETRVNNLTDEKSQLQKSFNSLNQKNLELDGKVTSLSDELNKAYVKGNQWGWFFITTQLNWSGSRQYCKDHGGDLIILNSEVKQRTITSIVLEKFLGERVWIGLTDIQQEGSMKWVDTSPLNQGFWYSGEPNDVGGNEDCVELLPSAPVQNWNDLPCNDKRKGICEK